MKLDEIVPWGRSLTEYKLMFDLSEADLKKDILGCGDGPASFNSEMVSTGGRVVSFDPIYAFSKQEIQQRIEETYDMVISQAKQDSHCYVWTHFQNAYELGRTRLDVMHAFLRDFEVGLASGRYLPAALPSLPFKDRQFDLCLCSHLLFLYSEQLSLEFHLSSIQEVLRVASGLRIFPLLSLDGQPTPYLTSVQEHFVAHGYKVEIRHVPYEFQRGGDHMMLLKS